MAFFALLWKARSIENYRLKYEKEKINSLMMGNAQLEQTLSQRWRHYSFDTKKRLSRIFKKVYPDGSAVSNFFLYLMTDQTFPNFLLKSVMGFVGGIILTYLCFMFFVFQLAISLIHATIMSSIIGVLLTLGLAFSYRIRCLVFLLIPQFFSRVGRYTLTCYALVLILTGPATNTLKNSEVLSESMACTQEQIKTSVHQLNDLMKKPINAMKDSIKLMVDQLKTITAKVKKTVIRLDRLVLSIVNVIQSSFFWLQSVADICNAKLGTPYDRCYNSIQEGYTHCQESLGPQFSGLCNIAHVAHTACYSVKPFKAFCSATDFMDEAILASVKKKLRNFTEHLREMFHVEVHMHHSYSYSSNTSRSASQVAAGIVTEIRNRADPMLTWLSWSSCVTSLFLVLIIFRAKYYQHMYETRSRFDNRYVTKELQQLDLKRQQQGRQTVLPLNRRERAKYITTSSFRLVASEKVYLNRSAVFMAITTFKLLIHMVADYSLYWVLMTIRCHGRFQSDLMPGIPHSGAHVSGSGFVARLFSSIIGILDIPLAFPASAPISCLPDPYPPDLRRYMQIGVLIFLLWFFALFEPYGLRLRHLIMGHYRPERAKARATWLYNHILRTRGSFMKFARRKLHREYKYSSEASLTFRQWITDHVPFQCLRSLVGLVALQPHCLLCGITSSSDPDSRLTKASGLQQVQRATDRKPTTDETRSLPRIIKKICQTPGCPGVFCMSCFTDIGELCTICLSPADYGDLSDVSLEKGSSDDDDSDVGLSEGRMNKQITLHSITENDRTIKSTRSYDDTQRWNFFTEAMGPRGPLDTIILAQNERSFVTNFFQQRLRKIQRNLKKRSRVRTRTLNWVAKVTPENMISKEESHNYYSNSLNIEESGFEAVTIRSKSIGINTDINRGVLLSRLVNRFTRRRLKQPRIKLKKVTSELKANNRKTSQQRIHRKKKHTNLASSRKTFSINSFNTYDLTLCQRNLKNIVTSNKERYSTKDKMKGYKELKGIMKALRYFRKSNEIKNMSNQNNDAPANEMDRNEQKNTESTDNANIGGRKNKKKCSKSNKPKKPKKQKDAKKIKTKNSRQRIAVFHKFFSDHWNNFKCSIIPGYQQNRSDIPIPKEQKNHKSRKKRIVGVELKPDIDECFGKKDIKNTRNLRINAYLAELNWSKRDYRIEEGIDEENNSALTRMCAPAPVTADNIVGMVHLKNLPFQWREARKREFYDSKGKKICVSTDSSTRHRLFMPLSKVTEKLDTKKALNRFRNKVNTVQEIPRLSLVKRLLRSISGVRDDSSFNRDSSICISKRASLYRSYGLNQDSDLLNMEMIFKNTNFDDASAQDPPASKPSFPSNFTEERSNLPSFLGKEIIVSCSSTEEKCRNGSHCRCDFYEDLQRKWDHVRKSIAELSGTKNPMSLVKNFCSSLFGPSCNVETCPNKEGSRAKSKKKRSKKLASDELFGKKTGRGLRNKKTLVSEEFYAQKTTAVQAPDQMDKGIDIQLSGEEGARKKTKQEEKENKGIQIGLKLLKPHKGVGTGSAPMLKLDNRDGTTQYVGQDVYPPKNSTAVGSSNMCICGEATQPCTPNQPCLNTLQTYCTCATQDSGITQLGMKYRDTIQIKQEVTTVSPVVSKKTQYQFAEDSLQEIHELTTESTIVNKNPCAGVSFQPINEVTTVSSLANNRTQHLRAGESFQPMNEVTTVSPLANNRTQHLRAGESFQPMNEVTTVSPLANKKTQYKCARESFQAINEVTTVSPMVNKKIQHYGAEVADKATHCTARKHYKKGKDMKSGVSKMDRQLSLGSSFLLGLGSKTAEALKEELTTDTDTETVYSSSSLRSDGSKSDTTICSLATFNRNDSPKRRKFRVKVVTKANQSTITDTPRVCDTGTATHDWWSPMIERKRYDEILLEKKKGLNVIDKETKHLREQKEMKELKVVKKRLKNSGVAAEARNVSFRSRAQIIPSDHFPGKDIMSPSRFLLESQRYYNELYAYNNRPRPQVYNYVTQMPKYLEKEKSRSPAGSRRNHLHKTKRLDECYSPRKQLSPRKRKTDSTRTSDSPRRKPTHRQHDRQLNNRHQAKTSPRKRI